MLNLKIIKILPFPSQELAIFIDRSETDAQQNEKQGLLHKAIHDYTTAAKRYQQLASHTTHLGKKLFYIIRAAELNNHCGELNITLNQLDYASRNFFVANKIFEQAAIMASINKYKKELYIQSAKASYSNGLVLEKKGETQRAIRGYYISARRYQDAFNVSNSTSDKIKLLITIAKQNTLCATLNIRIRNIENACKNCFIAAKRFQDAARLSQTKHAQARLLTKSAKINISLGLLYTQTNQTDKAKQSYKIASTQYFNASRLVKGARSRVLHLKYLDALHTCDNL